MKMVAIENCHECPNFRSNFWTHDGPCECQAGCITAESPEELFKLCPLPNSEDYSLKEGVEISDRLWPFEDIYKKGKEMTKIIYIALCVEYYQGASFFLDMEGFEKKSDAQEYIENLKHEDFEKQDKYKKYDTFIRHNKDKYEIRETYLRLEENE